MLEQRRAELHGAIKAKYYRVTWSGAPSFALKSVQGEYASTTRPAERATSAVPGAAGPKPGEFVFDLGARLPVEALRIVPAEANSVSTFTLFARDTLSGDWRTVTSAVFYRLERGGTQLESGAVEIGRHPARYWMARVDPGTGGVGATPPALEVQWRSAQVVFAARGPAPFHLAFGAPEARPGWVNVATLVPGYKQGDELKLPQASRTRGGQAACRCLRAAGIRRRARPAQARALGGPVIGVLVLGGMAWRLSRQLREGEHEVTDP